jgi:hypothetical protein
VAGVVDSPGAGHREALAVHILRKEVLSRLARLF